MILAFQLTLLELISGNFYVGIRPGQKKNNLHALPQIQKMNKLVKGRCGVIMWGNNNIQFIYTKDI